MREGVHVITESNIQSTDVLTHIPHIYPVCLFIDISVLSVYMMYLVAGHSTYPEIHRTYPMVHCGIQYY